MPPHYRITNLLTTHDTSVLGYSKRLTERLTASFSTHHPGRFISVRFGNVLGSRGSVLPAFTEQIRGGHDVTVTHPDVERYFMLIPEASQLVLQAAVLGRGGEVMVLDMGKPVRILDIAQALIHKSGRHDIDIRFTGLRQGEKLTEDLFSRADDQRSTGHPLVTCVQVPPLSPRDLPGFPEGDTAVSMRDLASEDRAPTDPLATAVLAQSAVATHVSTEYEQRANKESATHAVTPNQGRLTHLTPARRDRSA